MAGSCANFFQNIIFFTIGNTRVIRYLRKGFNQNNIKTILFLKRTTNRDFPSSLFDFVHRNSCFTCHNSQDETGHITLI